eukprot:TRINITY_DN112799_c0_g1_i1.p1 TRINITY_DN112799_c0_g1~~TRINITY_DN112799_c0_g1_i1.p1  ORF type:complete len:414 (-),score=68.19 TRINITY_DN112799_c0_g1_i1:246-1466(-)
MASKWASVATAPADALFGLLAKSRADTCPTKVDLSVGAYRDDEGRPYLLKVIEKTEKALADSKLDKEYLPIDGFVPFRAESAKLLLGENSKAIAENRIATAQTISGTGALRVAAEFYARFSPRETPVYLSNPTWVNHEKIFKGSGFTRIEQYRYFHAETKGVDFAGMSEDLKAAPEGSIVILQMCAHNPTGADPSKEEWQTLADICQQNKLNVIFDCAYQGYATGDLENDAYAVRLFEERGIEFLACQSYSKNMGLYGERAGCIVAVTTSADVATAINSQFKVIIRPMYSNPPVHGARLVHAVLSDPKIRQEWTEELKVMSGRIGKMRQTLQDELEKINTPGSWNHITKQIGMFSFTGLNAKQCDAMVDKHHVYMMKSGRISIAGLSEKTCAQVAAAMKDVITTSE